MRSISTLDGQSSFQPTLLIGIGRDSHFYTLRETRLRYIPGSGPGGNAVVNGVYQGTVEITSGHVCNLSQNADEAIAKAELYAANMGVKLASVTAADLQGQLDDILRMTTEQTAARDEAIRIKHEANEALYALEQAQLCEVIDAGFMPFGRYTCEAFEKMDAGYTQWMMSDVERFEAGTLMRRIADKLVRDYPELAPREMDRTAILGQPKERLTMDVEVVRKASFDSEWGRTYIVTMVTPDGVCIVSRGSFFAETGDKFKIKATVKKHDDYKGQAQTVVQRVAVIESAA